MYNHYLPMYHVLRNIPWYILKTCIINYNIEVVHEYSFPRYLRIKL